MKTVTIEIPIAERARGYPCRYICQALTPKQSQRMQRLIFGLAQSGAVNRDGRFRGRPVASTADVIRWILSQVPD